MVGKTNKKKTVVDASSMATMPAMDLTGFIATIASKTDHGLALFHEVLTTMMTKGGQQDQVRHLQSQKKKLKDSVSTEAWQLNCTETQNRLAAYIQLYVAPQYDIQSSLDWIMASLKDLQASYGESVTALVRNVCWSIVVEAIQECIPSNSTTVDLARVSFWTPGFNGLCQLNHETSWLSGGEEAYKFFSFLHQIAFAQVQYIHDDSNTTQLSSRSSKTSDDNLRSTIRNMSVHFAIIKEQLHAETAARWSELLSRSKVLSIDILQSKLIIDKDIIAAAASLYVSLCIFEQNADNLLEEAARFSALAHACILKSYIHLSPLTTMPAMELILQRIIALFAHHDCEVQLVGLQTVETWSNKLRSILSTARSTNSSDTEIADHAQRLLIQLVVVLIPLWDHPVRQLNHLVPTIFEKLLKLLATDILSFRPSADTTVWKLLLDQCMGMGSQFRGKFQALRIVISTAGTACYSLIDSCFLDSLVFSARTRDIASAVSFLIGALCELTQQLQQQPEQLQVSAPGKGDDADAALAPSSIQQRLLRAIVTALSSDDQLLRKNMADYVVPVVLKVSPAFAPQMMRQLLHTMLSFGDSPSASVGAGQDMSQVLVRITRSQCWALVHLVLHCKLLNQFTTLPLSVAENELLQGTLLRAVCQSADDDIRLSALTSVTASLKASASLSTQEATLITENILYSLKTSDVDDMQHLHRVLRAFYPRLKASAVGSKATPDASSAALETALDVPATEEAMISIFHRLCYPGSTQDSEFAGLSYLQCILDNNQVPVSEYLVQFLVQHCFHSDWDKSRDLAVQLLRKLPVPWAGYRTATTLRQLYSRGVQLAQQAKLRESDAGAKLLCSLYTSYALGGGFDISAAVQNTSEDEALVVINKDEAAISFIGKLLGPLESTIATLANIFRQFLQFGHLQNLVDQEDQDNNGEAEGGEFPLVHGLLLALRLVLERTAQSSQEKVRTSTATTNTSNGHLFILNAVKARVLAVAQHCLQQGLSIVAEYVSDDIFAPSAGDSSKSPSTSQEGTDMSTKGPVNSATAGPGGYSMAAVYVNTNTFTDTAAMSTSSGSNNNTNEVEGEPVESSPVNEAARKQQRAGLAAQRAIVAAWLIVKESAALLAVLVELSPSPPADTSFSESASFLLSTQEIGAIGQALLDALGRLKHMGAIAETHVALQRVTAHLLRLHNPPASLLALPRVWLDRLLQRLVQRQQVFILRRSAGFAYSFLSLLRAEPAQAAAPLLHRAMSSLIEVVARGLQDSSSSTVAKGSSTSAVEELKTNEEDGIDGEEEWKLSVHALNVLRLIILDGAFSFELDVHLSSLFVLTLNGFQHRIWAVRNSCMMVFSAMVQKCVAKDKNSSDKQLSTSVAAFFRRFPGLSGHLLQQLESFVRVPMWTSQQEHCLFPSLLLLAKCKSVFSAEETVEQNSAVDVTNIDVRSSATNAAFVTVIQEHFLGHVSAAVRQIAARALSALIAIDDVPQVLAAHWQGLISRASTDSASSLHLSSDCTANRLHGALLLTQTLLTTLAPHIAPHLHHPPAQYRRLLYSLLVNATVAFSAEAASVVSLPMLLVRLQPSILALNAPAISLVYLQSLQTLNRLLFEQASVENVSEDRHLVEDALDHTLPTLQTIRSQVQDFVGPVLQTLQRFVHHSVQPYFAANSSSSKAVMVHADVSNYEDKEHLRGVFLQAAGQELMYQLTSQLLTSTTQVDHDATIARSLLVLRRYIDQGLVHRIKEVREGVIDGLLLALEAFDHDGKRGSESAVRAIEDLTFCIIDAGMTAVSVESDAVLVRKLWQLLAVLVHQLPPSSAGSVDTDERYDQLEKLAQKYLYTRTAAEQQTGELQTTTPTAYVAEVYHALQHLHLSAHTISQQSQSHVQRWRKWLQVLSEAAVETQPVSLRLTSATALHDCLPLLLRQNTLQGGDHSEEVTRTVQVITLLISTLLQDDDHNVRETANAASHAFFCSLLDNQDVHETSGGRHPVWISVAQQLHSKHAEFTQALLPAVPAVVPRTLERWGLVLGTYLASAASSASFAQHVASILPQLWLAATTSAPSAATVTSAADIGTIVDALRQEVMQSVQRLRQCDAAAASASWNKIFDAEPANLYKQPLWLSQPVYCAALHLIRSYDGDRESASKDIAIDSSAQELFVVSLDFLSTLLRAAAGVTKTNNDQSQHLGAMGDDQVCRLLTQDTVLFAQVLGLLRVLPALRRATSSSVDTNGKVATTVVAVQELLQDIVSSRKVTQQAVLSPLLAQEMHKVLACL